MKNSKSRRRIGVESLLEMYGEKKAAIQARLKQFALMRPEHYFYELLYCLMTPQSSAEHADKVVTRLQDLRFFESGIDPEPFLRDRNHYIRFHRTKAKLLLKAREDFGRVRGVLADGYPAVELREWLVGNVKGLGYKEATHFLRNIGRNSGLAILDRHILRNLKRFGVLHSVPSTLTRKRYLMIESRFKKFSESVGIPIDELDLLFWSMETGQIRK